MTWCFIGDRNKRHEKEREESCSFAFEPFFFVSSSVIDTSNDQYKLKLFACLMRSIFMFPFARKRWWCVIVVVIKQISSDSCQWDKKKKQKSVFRWICWQWESPSSKCEKIVKWIIVYSTYMFLFTLNIFVVGENFFLLSFEQWKTRVREKDVCLRLDLLFSFRFFFAALEKSLK